MTKTNIPYFTLRLLTVFSYFLPFVFYLSTCTDDLTGKDAYNKADAIKNEKSENQFKLDRITSFIATVDTITVNREAAMTELLENIKVDYNTVDKSLNPNEDLEMKIYFPTKYSLSAIGTIVLHKDTLGKILIGFSVFISLITLIFWAIIDRNKIAIYLFSVNILAVLVFIVDSYFSNVTLLFGTWTLLFILTTQLLTEIQARKKPNH